MKLKGIKTADGKPTTGTKSGAVRVRTHADPKPHKGNGIPTAWAKYSLSKETLAACKDYADNRAARFNTYCRVAAGLFRDTMLAVAKDIITKSEMRFYAAVKAAPKIGAATREELAEIGFRKWTDKDPESIRKVLQGWQADITHFLNAGKIIDALADENISIDDAGSKMNARKLRALPSLWKRACKAVDVSFTAKPLPPKAITLLRKWYAWSLKHTDAEMNAQFKTATDDGGDSGDDLKTGGKGGKGGEVRYLKASRIVKDIKVAEHYKHEENIAIANAAIEVIRNAELSATKAKRIVTPTIEQAKSLARAEGERSAGFDLATYRGK